MLRIVGENPFHVIVTADDVTSGKPAPEPYTTAGVRLGRRAAECVVIEDSPAGIESARRAGMHCIAVRSTHGTHELGRADRVVDSVEEVESLLLRL